MPLPLVPPFDRIAARNPEFKRLFSVGDAFGPVETLMFMTKAAFVTKNRAALVDFLEDNIRMRRWMFDPKTRADAITQLSDTTKIPVAEYAEWVYTKDDYYYHPQALVGRSEAAAQRQCLEAGRRHPQRDRRRLPMSICRSVKEAAARIKD